MNHEQLMQISAMSIQRRDYPIPHLCTSVFLRIDCGSDFSCIQHEINQTKMLSTADGGEQRCTGHGASPGLGL